MTESGAGRMNVKERVRDWLLGEFWSDPDEGSEAEADRLTDELLALIGDGEATAQLRKNRQGHVSIWPHEGMTEDLEPGIHELYLRPLTYLTEEE